MPDPLDLLILDSGEPKRIVAYARHGPNTAVELLPGELIAELEAFRDRLRQISQSGGNRPSATELSEFGQKLFDLALKNRLRDVYNLLPGDYVCIQVLSNQPAVQSLPWEYLQEPQGPGGPKNSRGVVRIVPTVGGKQHQPRPLGRKLRVLFAYADPPLQEPVDWEEMKDAIEGPFSQYNTKYGTNYEMTLLEAASIDALTSELLSSDYDVLHFLGHGRVRKGDDGKETSEIILTNADKSREEYLPAEELARLLENRNLQLVVLSACNTSAGDFSRPYAVIAQSLVEAGVPAVVANQFSISNTFAAAFAAGFYKGLFKTGDVDRAMSDGRTVMAAQRRNDDRALFEWGIPTLYRHVAGAQLFTP